MLEDPFVSTWGSKQSTPIFDWYPCHSVARTQTEEPSVVKKKLLHVGGDCENAFGCGRVERLQSRSMDLVLNTSLACACSKHLQQSRCRTRKSRYLGVVQLIAFLSLNCRLKAKTQAYLYILADVCSSHFFHCSFLFSAQPANFGLYTFSKFWKQFCGQHSVYHTHSCTLIVLPHRRLLVVDTLSRILMAGVVL